MTSFRDEVLTVLKKKNYVKHCYSLEEFLKTVECNKMYTVRKIFWYKWLGLFLLTSIPLISALLSVLVGIKGDSSGLMQETVILYLSFALTICTILNSIFKPSERFQTACRIGIAINSFIVKFLIEIEQKTTIDESELVEIVKNKQEEFEDYQVKLISMFMPVGAVGARS
jgi:uncharacterized membrane protein (DUF106 family)